VRKRLIFHNRGLGLGQKSAVVPTKGIFSRRDL